MISLAHILSTLSNFFHLILGIQPAGQFPPPLPQEEEKACFQKAAMGDAAARDKLILHNLRLVSHIVRKYYASSPCQDDLVSIGSIGLAKAVDSFNLQNGARFATYAAKCIQNEILMYFRSRKKLSNEISIDETIDIDRDGNPLTYMDVISTEECIADEINRKIQVENALKYVETLLTPRERQIIMMRYGLYGKKAFTQRETADVLHISRSYVSRIEKGALEKLRTALLSPRKR